MRIPLELALGDVVHPEFVEQSVREHVAKLERVYDGATRCRVSVDAPHAHRRSGRHYEVRVELTVPGDTLVVSEHTGRSDAHEEVHVALRDAFKGLERQLLRWKERRRDTP